MYCPNCQQTRGGKTPYCENCGSQSTPVAQVPPQTPSNYFIQSMGPPAAAPSPQGMPHNQVYVAPQSSAPLPSQTINVNVSAPFGGQMYPARSKASAAFAIITLLFYLFGLWPIAAALNFVGMIAGPRRGCFVSMFFLIFIPGMLLIGAYIILAMSGALAGS